ncbi:TRAP transporter, 4TM/12TM fusion protein [alpha proteobacterium BAL199]|jgi:TRAP transporter 4TM/12TM fusion protein|nr:TRAP transporter, 4TM/12TM fusion protein [alpha proteobacterium BAL199]
MPRWTRLAQGLITAVGLAMTLYHLYTAWFGAPDALSFRAIHVAFALVLAFLIFPARTGGSSTPDIGQLVLAGLSIIASGYILWGQDYINNRMIYVDDLRPEDWVLGSLLILLLLEATRRCVGLALPLTAITFLLYAVFGAGSDLPQLMEQMYLGTEGIFGIPVSVSATYVMLFILFGAMVERTGTGKLFMDFAMALTGHTAGGPAKVACITSGLFGTVSGSAVANVMTTGAFSIPLMKKLGYRPAFAGAVEAVASTGGQIMPPIMGAAAFVMAEFLGVSYLTVAAYALIPAAMYFLAVFLAVHFEAKRTGMRGLPRSELPRLFTVLKEQGHLFLPLVVIVGALVAGYSAPLSALFGIASVLVAAALRKSTRHYLTPANILDGLVSGARNTVSVALACGCAGIVIGVISLTGLGIEFTSLVLAASQNHLVLALVLTMMAGIVLGMGMPTTPAYIVQVALLVPALVKLGIIVEAAHMFTFYFAILSAITPPVALAVYAANGLSNAGLWETGLLALKLGATGYIVPFMFVFGPSLLMIGEPVTIVITAITAMLGVVCLAAGLAGYLLASLALWQRLALISAAIVLIKPGLYTDAIGIGILAAVAGLNLLMKNREAPDTV